MHRPWIEAIADAALRFGEADAPQFRQLGSSASRSLSLRRRGRTAGARRRGALLLGLLGERLDGGSGGRTEAAVERAVVDAGIVHALLELTAEFGIRSSQFVFLAVVRRSSA